MNVLWRPLVIVSLSPGGCATAPRQHSASGVEPVDYQARTTSALVFDPPVIAGEEPSALERAGRQQSAFMGWDESITEYYSVRTDDRQTQDARRDRYERRAATEKVGVRYR